MTRSRCDLVRITALAAVLAVVVGAAAWVVPAVAAPTSRAVTQAPPAVVASSTAGPASIVLDPSISSVPSGSGFKFGARVASSEPLDFLQARLRLLMPGGSLIYQKTFVEQSVDASSVSFVYERRIDDIGLDAAAYPVELGVDVQAGGETSRTVLPGRLYVYDPAREAQPIALVARISAQPLADPQGRFVSDPATFTRARDDAQHLAEWVISSPNARLTLCLSPVMVREWTQIAGGYQLIGAEGTVDVPPTELVPMQYGYALDTIRRAVATGRLEIASEGYSDPDLFELDGADLLDDIARQYERGNTALTESLWTTPTAGTAPPHGVPDAALPRLARAGVGYVVIPAAQARRDKQRPAGGVYRAGDSALLALIADSRASRAVASSSTAEVFDVAFERYLKAARNPQPLPVLVTLGPDAADASWVTSTANQLAAAPWTRMVTGSEAVSRKALRRVSLTDRKPDEDAPDQYWDRVAESRIWAEALAFALPADAPEGMRAVRQSLVAQSSAWAGHDGSWTPATSGLAYAMSATESAHDVLDNVALTASRITLAGAKGTVPVTISNKTEQKLRVVLLAEPGPGVKLGGSTRTETTLEPGDNFVELAVSLDRGFSSTLQLRLMADRAELASKTVPLQTSYLDRLVIGAGVLALLAGLLVFIIRRVRSAESADLPVEDHMPEQLTLGITDENGGDVRSNSRGAPGSDLDADSDDR